MRFGDYVPRLYWDTAAASLICQLFFGLKGQSFSSQLVI